MTSNVVKITRGKESVHFLTIEGTWCACMTTVEKERPILVLYS